VEGKTYTLIEIIRDPEPSQYEVEEIDPQGHHVIYKYNSLDRVFFKATVPSGAAAPFFMPIRLHEKLPFGGWVRAQRLTSQKIDPTKTGLRVLNGGKSNER
jgi:hypothetical protein